MRFRHLFINLILKVSRGIKKLNYKDFTYKTKVKKREKFLKERFLKFTKSFDKSLTPTIEKLISQQGKIDYESEGLSNKENQRDLSIKFAWGHNHNFGNGI